LSCLALPVIVSSSLSKLFLSFSSIFLPSSLHFLFSFSSSPTLLLFCQYFIPLILFSSFECFLSLAHTLYVEEINAMRHQSTEKLARNLEQLLSGPKVGAETKSAHTPAGTGAGGGGGGGGVGVESDQSKGGEGDGSDSSSASLSEQEVKSSEPDAVPVSIPSNVFSFARITQVRHSCVLISLRHIYSPVMSSHHISPPYSSCHLFAASITVPLY
jgi:hypothetical protein